ncbi:glycoside hydrolase family 3 protein [Candidatus Izimaplasma bacterium]|nr:glycoside hydrolase family 3 protein [Candidatus Izimaplasma bacterium]
MKKILVFILSISFIFTLSACVDNTPQEIDCAIDPNHADCIEEEVDCDVTPTDPSCTEDPETYCEITNTTCIEEVEEIIAGMTLREKAAQMVQAERANITVAQVMEHGIGSILSGGGSHPNGYDSSIDEWYLMYNNYQTAALASSSGIPLIYGIDSVHGNNNLYKATIFPHNIGLGAANDPDLMYRIGAATAKETLALGITWTFAPALSVVQDIRWGRTYEGYSENTIIQDNLSYPIITGLQDNGVSASAKHYLGDGGTSGGNDQGNVILSEAEIRRIHLQPYFEAIRAETDTIMISYSSINGSKMHGSEYWINDVLKEELGFEGFIISDYEAIHQLSGTYRQQVTKSINAGIDMLMEPIQWENAIDAIVDATLDGDITIERVNDAVRRILQIKHKRGLLENPYFRYDDDVVYNEEHEMLAREAVRKSLVLLKNSGLSLPLDKDEKIYITGPASNNVGLLCGGWTRVWQGVADSDMTVGTSIYEGIEDVLESFGGTIVDSISEADTVIVVLAETTYAEFNGDSDVLTLTGGKSHPANIPALEEALTAHNQGKNVVGILISGRPLLLEDYLDRFDSFIAAWLPGTEGGSGISDVLFGDYNFTGKLSFTWPLNSSQFGYNSNDPDYDSTSVLYPFGYGLTYSD